MQKHVFTYYGLLLTTLFIACGVPSTTVSANCDTPTHEQAHQAYQQRNADTLLTLLAQCDDDYMRELTGRVLYDSTKGLQDTALRERLEKVLEVSPNPSESRWRANLKLADMATQLDSFPTAFHHYEAALDSITSTDLKAEDGPTASEFLSIRQEMEKVRLLSDSFIPITRRRDGSLSGAAQFSYRGSAPVKSAFPIHFHTKQATLTAEGEAAVAELEEVLRSNQSPAIEIVGHADERGTPEANLTLSRQRAETIHAYLKQKAYTGKVTVTGKGETEHYDDPDYERFPKDKQWRLDRRVQVDMKSTPNH